MKNEVETKLKKKNERIYLTQKELADRWRVTTGTIKAIRLKGLLPCFFPPGSSRVLYPIDEIIKIEKKNQVKPKNKEAKQKKILSETQVKKPVNPAKSDREWRI